MISERPRWWRLYTFQEIACARLSRCRKQERNIRRRTKDPLALLRGECLALQRAPGTSCDRKRSARPVATQRRGLIVRRPRAIQGVGLCTSQSSSKRLARHRGPGSGWMRARRRSPGKLATPPRPGQSGASNTSDRLARSHMAGAQSSFFTAAVSSGLTGDPAQMATFVEVGCLNRATV